MGRRHDRDDDAPSWRDIDRGKDKSSHTDQNRDAYGQRRSKSSYYKERLDNLMKERLERVFSDPERDKASRKILDAVTGAERKEATEAYLAEYDLPEDFETMLAMAEVKDDAIFARVLPAMAELWDEQPLSRRKVAKETLQMRLMRVRDKESRAIAAKLIEQG